jgi:hypothetical protein
MEYLGQHYNKEAVLGNIVVSQSGVVLEDLPLVYEHLLVRRVHALPLSALDDPLDLAHLQKSEQALSRVQLPWLSKTSSIAASTTLTTLLIPNLPTDVDHYCPTTLDMFNSEHPTDAKSQASASLTRWTPRSGPIHTRRASTAELNNHRLTKP